eukprot:1768141-Prymnesium_polylepis.1
MASGIRRLTNGVPVRKTDRSGNAKQTTLTLRDDQTVLTWSARKMSLSSKAGEARCVALTDVTELSSPADLQIRMQLAPLSPRSRHTGNLCVSFAEQHDEAYREVFAALASLLDGRAKVTWPASLASPSFKSEQASHERQKADSFAACLLYTSDAADDM